MNICIYETIGHKGVILHFDLISSYLVSLYVLRNKSFIIDSMYLWFPIKLRKHITIVTFVIWEGSSDREVYFHTTVF